MMNSCIYEIKIMHQRLSPRRHRFSYGLYMFLIDLDEITVIENSSRLLRFHRAGLFSFWNEDHLQKNGTELKSKLIQFLRSNEIEQDVKRILILTNLRHFGYVFNPLSIIVCLGVDDEPICAVAEVNNTFLERKLFLLESNSGISGTGTAGDVKSEKATATKPTATSANGKPRVFKSFHRKNFYVSPFSRPDLDWSFYVKLKDESLVLSVNEFRENQTVFVSTMRGRRKELSDKSVLFYALKYPLVTLKVITAIHVEAFRLLLKRIPFYEKDQLAEHQLEVINPHSKPFLAQPVRTNTTEKVG